MALMVMLLLLFLVWAATARCGAIGCRGHWKVGVGVNFGVGGVFLLMHAFWHGLCGADVDVYSDSIGVVNGPNAITNGGADESAGHVGGACAAAGFVASLMTSWSSG